MREHPIPAVTEPFQYRAIGFFRGTYIPNDANQFTRGTLVDHKGEEIDAVVLGRVMSLMKRHLSLQSSHLWVVYPRCRDQDNLHLQITGIWEPSTLSNDILKSEEKSDIVSTSCDESDKLPEGDDFFSIRGELIYTKPENNDLVIKIRQKPRNNFKKPIPFKLSIKGEIPLVNLRNFVSLDVRRIGKQLTLEQFDIIGPINTRGGKKIFGKK